LLPIKNGRSHLDGDFTRLALLITVDFASIHIQDHLSLISQDRLYKYRSIGMVSFYKSRRITHKKMLLVQYNFSSQSELQINTHAYNK
jgi:hypothetical protein